MRTVKGRLTVPLMLDILWARSVSLRMVPNQMNVICKCKYAPPPPPPPPPRNEERDNVKHGLVVSQGLRLDGEHSIDDNHCVWFITHHGWREISAKHTRVPSTGRFLMLILLFSGGGGGGGVQHPY